MSKHFIGVDIGGTKVASGIINEKGKVVSKITLPTLAEKGMDTSMAQVLGSIDTLISSGVVKKTSIKGIGLCAPGPLDPIKGVVHNPPNLPGWVEVPLAGMVKRRFKINTRIENDANAAGKAEVVWGAGKGHKNIFYITVSTGIGTGIIIDGKIYHGKNGMAGEGGHVCMDYKSKKVDCGCGNTGCVEGIASGPATAKRVAVRLKKDPGVRTILRKMSEGNINNITMKMIGEAAKKNDKIAIEAIKEQGDILGIWVGTMINVLDPEVVVIGGGVSSIGRLIFDQIRRSALQHTINIFAKNTPIVRAKLRSNVGVYGAASLMM